MLKETYETTKGTCELEILPRKEQNKIADLAEQYFNKWDRALCTVYGFAGSGKSYLVKNSLESIKENHAKEHNVFCAYLDISDCLDEAEVYYRIALQLKDYYKELNLTEKNQVRNEMENTNKLIRLYEWVKGIHREDLAVVRGHVEIAGDVASFIENKTKGISGNSTQSNDSEFLENLAEDILLGVSAIVPIARDIRQIVDATANIKGNLDKMKLKRLLIAKIDILDNRVMFEDYLIGKLKRALPNKTKSIIALDNFQMNPNNELARTYTWLTVQNKLMKDVNAMWIVVSRMPTHELFNHLFEKAHCYSIESTGFDEDLAKEYLIKNCLKQSVYQNYDFLEEDEKNIIQGMLHAANLRGDNCYLPYLLRMIVLYYWKVKETPGVTITPDMFLNMDTEEDFIGYYFYKDLSDLMVNAFQILSCLSVWDDVWIDVVQKKIDNHLLNTRNLLEHKAPIESLGGTSFKLHEALKDGLYNNRQNYIKIDVMKHLFESFINIFEGNEANDNKNIWYNLKRLRMFVEIVFEYIRLDVENQKKNLKAIRKAMDEIYQNQKERGTVSEAYIQIYAFYIDSMKKIYNIPFADTLNNNFIDEDGKQWGYRDITDAEQDDLIYYMTCCFKLADLYTNHNQNGIAQRLEAKCVQFWDNQLQGIESDAARLQNKSVWYYRCWQQKVKALNATAYDYSAEHDYKNAIIFGKKGLTEAQKLGIELIEQIEPEQKEMLLILLNPDDAELFAITNGAYTEIPYELYDRLQQAYKEIWQMKNVRNKVEVDQDADKTEKTVILSELFIKNQQDLRGNYPWYCLMNQDLLFNNENGENYHQQWILYGVRTYWMRRAMFETLKQSELKTDKNLMKNVTARMLKSYHNICVYLSKNGKVEKACILANEVLKESRSLLAKKNPNIKSLSFIERITKTQKENDDKLLWYLWKRQGLNEETGKDFYSQPEVIVEQMQYMGDFYLNMRYYSLALQWLSEVLLNRIGSLGNSDSKTLDTIMRFYIAVYAEKKKNGKLLKDTEDYIKQYIIKDEKYLQELKIHNQANGVLQKCEKMAKMLEIGSKEGDIECIVSEMISELQK